MTQMDKEPKGKKAYQSITLKNFQEKLRKSCGIGIPGNQIILKVNLVIYTSPSVYSCHGVSSLAKLYIAQGINISGLPHLSLFSIPNNRIKETIYNELMRCVACLGLFLDSPSRLHSWVLAPWPGSSSSSKGPLCRRACPGTPSAASAHSTLCLKENHMAGLGKGPLKKKQGAQAKKINTEKKETKAASEKGNGDRSCWWENVGSRPSSCLKYK